MSVAETLLSLGLILFVLGFQAWFFAKSIRASLQKNMEANQAVILEALDQRRQIHAELKAIRAVLERNGTA